MLSPAFVIARKEIVDHLRDARSLVSAGLYALMGPLVVLLVSFATKGASKPEQTAMILGMLSVFCLVSAFVGGMNVALDVIAGERERHSLLPLLTNPISRLDVLCGKWLATSLFAASGLALNLLGSAMVVAALGTMPPGAGLGLLLLIALGLAPLALLAAALQLLISTFSRNAKEAQTYLSLIVFLPMGAGMLLLFLPRMAGQWWFLLPIAGQQVLMNAWVRGEPVAFIARLILGWITAGAAALLLVRAASLLRRDEVVYDS
jgi:sodium transport system permease protein